MTARKPPTRGVLVAFEGIDGAGKTTQAELLARALAARGLDVVRTKEPTSGPHGQVIRRSAATGRLPPAEELALFHADRREHVAEVIAPALAAGKVVIVDRYFFSSAAYQGARGLDPEAILRENEGFAPLPDLLVFLDLEPEVGLARVHRRGGSNLFEELASLERCATIFRRLERPYVARIDGALPVEEAHAAVLRALDRLAR
jgi:dTMP kinase